MLPIILATIELNEQARSKFEKIYYTYNKTLLSYALRLMKNQADAEDVLHEAFIKVAKNLNKIDAVNNRETLGFLTVILRNTAYDFLRKGSKIQEVSLCDTEEIVDIDSNINRLTDDLGYSDIVKAIKNIPSPYTEVLYLHYVRDLSVKETARLLERKAETVKIQLVRGKKILLNSLAEVEL